MAVDLVVPGSVAEATALLASSPTARALAGGTDLVLDLESGRVDASTLVSLRRLPWRFVRREGEALVIGSTHPLAELERRPDLARDWPGLSHAIRAIGGVALRNQATVGGNLGRASPASDLLPILIALDATADVVGPRARRTVAVASLPVSSRHTTLGAGELVESVRIPHPAPCEYLWQRVRPANDVSQVGVAVAHHPGESGWRVVIGGVPPIPRRIPEAEAALGAGPLEEAASEAAAAAADAIEPRTDRRATSAYRRHLIAVLTERAVRQVGGLPAGG